MAYKVPVVIPARFGSTRFPGKPLALIAGKPMIQHVYERVTKWERCSEVYVATDNIEIMELIGNLGGSVFYSQESYENGTARVAAAVKECDIDGMFIINVQGDEPLITTEALDKLMEPFDKCHQVDVTTLAHEITDPKEINDPNVVKVVINRFGKALYFSRSPIPYGYHKPFRHVGLYAYSRPTLFNYGRGMVKYVAEEFESLEQLRILENGGSIGVVECNYKSMGVDIPEDIKKVEKLLLTE